MDPNANLAEQRFLRAKIQKIWDSASEGFTSAETQTLVAAGVRLAELSEALDEWIKGSGALPKEWDRCGRFLPSGVSCNLRGVHSLSKCTG